MFVYSVFFAEIHDCGSERFILYDRLLVEQVSGCYDQLNFSFGDKFMVLCEIC